MKKHLRGIFAEVAIIAIAILGFALCLALTPDPAAHAASSTIHSLSK